jgi:hypothetical protein
MLNQINYILLDAARMGETIETAKGINPDFDSLYRGRSEESLAVVAPYLFIFKQNTEFGQWYIENGWGDAWGILIRSYLPMPELHKHFRKFLIVGTEDNQELYFRFYDPRVLRIFLPTCDQQQLREFFGPIEYFIMEDEDKDWAIRCWLENGHLHSVKISLVDLVNNNFMIPAVSKKEISVEPETPANSNPPVKSKSTKFDPFGENENLKQEPNREQKKEEPKDEPPPSKNDKSKWKDFFFE